MKNIIQLLAPVALFVVACHSGSNEHKHQHDAAAVKSEPKFAGVQFASLKDTSCGMTLHDIADTVMLDDKIYGFCSADCKEEFVASLKKENKR